MCLSGTAATATAIDAPATVCACASAIGLTGFSGLTDSARTTADMCPTAATYVDINTKIFTAATGAARPNTADPAGHGLGQPRVASRTGLDRRDQREGHV